MPLAWNETNALCLYCCTAVDAYSFGLAAQPAALALVYNFFFVKH